MRKYSRGWSRTLSGYAWIWTFALVAMLMLQIASFTSEASAKGGPKNTPFDFSLSVNPSSGSVGKGNNISTTATISLVSGSTEPVYFSCSDLPSGVSCSFSQPSCSPTCSSTLTIYTSSTTNTGSYLMNILAASGDNTKSQPYNLTVVNTLLISMFTPTLPSDVKAVLDRQLSTQDYAANFRTSMLSNYPNQHKILISNCVTCDSTTSINAAINNAKSSSFPIEYVAYDNEPKNGALSTPTIEVNDPVYYTNQAAALVHNAGLKFGATPSRDLLLAEYKGVDWTQVDLLVIQAQRITTSVARFNDLVIPVATHVKSINPNTLIFVQVNPDLDNNTNIVNVIKGVMDLIDGVSIVCNSCSSTALDDLITRLKSL